jgi:hypothetical protein
MAKEDKKAQKKADIKLAYARVLMAAREHAAALEQNEEGTGYQFDMDFFWRTRAELIHSIAYLDKLLGTEQ